MYKIKMNINEILPIYVKKLNHPLKEIRERSLQLLTAKLKLGWELNDELSGTRELLEALLAWFNTPQPSLQSEAFQLLLNSIKTKSGAYIVREFGIPNILSHLKKIRHKIAAEATEIYDDVIETLRFLNTVESDCNVGVTMPRLILSEESSLESEDPSNSAYYNLRPNCQSSSVSSGSDATSNKNVNISESVRILLFPWVDLCKSDKKSFLLVEDSLRLLKSTRRCCRFIRDVFLRDFPPEIFLNRPEIIKYLWTMSDGHYGGRPGEALLVLLCITRALRSRLSQLLSFHLIHEDNKISDDFKDVDEDVNIELQEIAGEVDLCTSQVDDGLLSLRQLPAPVYALDTVHLVLSIVARNAVLVDPGNNIELLDLRELNRCLCLIEELIGLLLDCIHPNFWNIDHSTKTYRDISHKSCMAMRLLGDVLNKYRESFLKEPDRCHHRLVWLRLIMCAQKLLNWAKDSALPPTTLIIAMQLAQLDPAIDLFYPEFSKNIDVVLQNTKTSVNQEYKCKYRELQKLFTSMDEAVLFVKKKSLHTTKTILPCIRKLLPVLELFQNENLLYEISDILLKKTRDMDLNDNDWAVAQSIVLTLMSHNLSWVQVTFYKLLADMVKSILIGDDNYQSGDDKCLTLLCDVGILTELCCHGLSSKVKEVEESAADIMLYLLRGRLVLSENCWWKLLASLLPVLPLLHVYAAHDTQLGKAICKCFDGDIADCMGVSRDEVIAGLVRLLFVKCVAVQLDAAHTLCTLLDDDRYLPPKESLRADILLSALRRVQPQEFNVDSSSSPSKTLQTGGLIQILDVLKQDIVIDENDEFVSRRSMQPTLDPSLRRSTLQQLAVMMRQQDLHDTFIQADGVKLIVATLRMSLMVDDYFAFPECAISCVSVLNSVCFECRHNLVKISDLSLLLIRVILVFPANDSCVLMTSQILSLVSWAGFALQELDSSRHRVPALPLCVTDRTSLPFSAHSYWNTSPNAEHSYIEWLLTEEEWRTAIRVRWWCVNSGRSRLLTGAPPTAPLALRVTPRDLEALRASCPLYSCTKALLNLQNATTHKQVTEALHMLESYVHLVPLANISTKEFSSLPWLHTKRFLCSPPASSRDTTLLCTLLHFVIAYIDNVPRTDDSMSWIIGLFIGNDADIVSLLSRNEIYPQQTVQESIEVIQLHINIVKVLLRCILLESSDCDTRKMESLLKILLACLDKIHSKNFHMLGYLNDLMRCIRYALYSHHCKLSEDTMIHCLRLISNTMVCCASGNGYKGQACRLDATLSILALLRQIHNQDIPVQRWCELFNSDVIAGVVKSANAGRVELRAAAIHVITALSYYAQMQPHLLQAMQASSLAEFAVLPFCQRGEANIVRAASASLLTSIASRASSRSDALESDVLQQLKEKHFVENCLEILIDFCNVKEYKPTIHPNISLSLLERRSELEVRAHKVGELCLPQTSGGHPAPPTADLVTSVAEALHNISAFPNCPIQHWNEQGLYRLLFRCCSWSSAEDRDTHQVRAASCRALLVVTSHKCVRTSLATTKDCLHNLVLTLTPIAEEDMARECLESRAQGLSVVASIVGERSAADNVWRMFTDNHADQFFHLLLQCLEIDYIELQDAALYCLTQLAQSMTNKRHVDKSKDETRAELYDNIKSPFWQKGPNERAGAGDSARSSDCQPEYIAEELCKALLHLFQKLSMDNKHQASQDERWLRVCSCISSILAASARSRQYAVHRQFPRVLLSGIQAVRDQLSLHGKPIDVIRNTNNNATLRTLFWLLTIIDCSMVNCVSAKESFAEENIALYLIKLWPWCMLTEQLRHAVVHLLYTYTNDCSKASSSMCVCVGGRTLTSELCALVVREVRDIRAAARSATLLRALHTLATLASNQHCRAIILKSECMSSMHRACSRARVSVPSTGHIWVWWARLCEALSRHSDGAAALLALRAGHASVAVLPQHIRALLLPAIAHAATHHRQKFLQTPELLELLCDTLLAGDTGEIVSATRAVWALAANNHKAKLVLRSAGITSAVHTTLQRLHKMRGDEHTERATQLLMYTNNVLYTA